ncbi:hypothetical protein RHA1_ro02645 [Rhodococcus jostii RHA1]|uniref:Uncharacterized protein n=1 Tax=Rhodococcus jostii (strain RHA1) TaxID=101510 RepID=Q0SDD6_RHOJR|nr:hypothetical protein RHA1_ro02645 [Rhodococcus jostii RHA1]
MGVSGWRRRHHPEPALESRRERNRGWSAHRPSEKSAIASRKRTVHEEVEQLLFGGLSRPATPTSTGTARRSGRPGGGRHSHAGAWVQVAAPYDPPPCRSAEDRPHRGGGERHDDHNHHHGDEGFVSGEKLLHDKKSPSPAPVRARSRDRTPTWALTACEKPAPTGKAQTTATATCRAEPGDSRSPHRPKRLTTAHQTTRA